MVSPDSQKLSLTQTPTHKVSVPFASQLKANVFAVSKLTVWGEKTQTSCGQIQGKHQNVKTTFCSFMEVLCKTISWQGVGQ